MFLDNSGGGKKKCMKACVRRANENAGNLISVVNFLVIINIQLALVLHRDDKSIVYVTKIVSCREQNNLTIADCKDYPL